MNLATRFSLEGRCALVTGAGSGIGASLAAALAEAGASVALADRDLVAAERQAATLATSGARVLALDVEVSESASVTRMVATVREAWGRLDVAVNSAGIALRAPAEELTEADWDAVLDIDLKGVYLCTQAEGRVMLAQGGGSIINIASMSGRIVNRPQLHAHYNAAKAGVIQFSRSCAAEWAARGVRVNCLSPGHTITPMTAHSRPEMGAGWLRNTPMGRLARPEDLQGAAIFLASAASAYVTGHDLVVDGGYTLW